MGDNFKQVGQKKLVIPYIIDQIVHSSGFRLFFFFFSIKNARVLA